MRIVTNCCPKFRFFFVRWLASNTPNSLKYQFLGSVVPLANFCCYCSSFLLLPKTESLFCFHLFCIILSLSCNLILIFWYLSAFLLSPASHPSHLKAISPVTGQTLYVSVNAFVQSPFYFFLYFIEFHFESLLLPFFLTAFVFQFNFAK